MSDKIVIYSQTPPEWVTEVDGNGVERVTEAGAKWLNEHGVDASCPQDGEQ